MKSNCIFKTKLVSFWYLGTFHCARLWHCYLEQQDLSNRIDNTKWVIHLIYNGQVWTIGSILCYRFKDAHLIILCSRPNLGSVFLLLLTDSFRIVWKLKNADGFNKYTNTISKVGSALLMLFLHKGNRISGPVIWCFQITELHGFENIHGVDDIVF